MVGGCGGAIPGSVAGHTGSSCPLLPRLCLIACSSPAALSLLTPFYMQLYHGDGILCSLSRRPKEKPGRELPADTRRCARTGVPSPLAGCGGGWGGTAPLCREGSPPARAVSNPGAGGGGGSGCGEEAPGDCDSLRRKINCQALQEVYHCHPRLAGSHLSLRLCVPGEQRGGGQGVLSPSVTLGQGHCWSPGSRHPSERGRVGPCSFLELCCSPSQQGPVGEVLPRAPPCVYGDRASPHPELRGPSAPPSSAAVMNRIFCIINN